MQSATSGDPATPRQHAPMSLEAGTWRFRTAGPTHKGPSGGWTGLGDPIGVAQPGTTRALTTSFGVEVSVSSVELWADAQGTGDSSAANLAVTWLT